MTDAELTRLFTDHPPNELTVLLHKRVNDAFENAANLEAPAEPGFGEPEHYAQMNTLFLDFARVINEVCPESADKTAAIRCVRLAREAADEWLKRSDAGRVPEIIGVELYKAKWQANAAIAHGVR